MDCTLHRLRCAGTEISLEIVPDAIHIMHKSLKHDEQELLTEDEIADAAAAAEEE